MRFCVATITITFTGAAIGVLGPIGMALALQDVRPLDASDQSSQLSAEVHEFPLTPDPRVLAAQQQQIDMLARATAATVAILDPSGQSGGSGVLISPCGLALTNFHVSAPCGAWMRCGLSDGQLYDAVIVGVDPTGDLALIQLLGSEQFPFVTLGTSDDVHPGDPCWVVGNPLLLATDFQPSVSAGIISGVRRYQSPAGTLLEYADCVQTDAAINPGNSGGPLFDQHSQLIGIVGRASFDKRGRVNVGVGYAISIDQVHWFLGHLRGGLIADHARLGATVALDDRGRVLVTNIEPLSNAARRGLKFGDQIIEIAGRPIKTANDVHTAVGRLPSDWRVPIVVLRDDQVHRMIVRLPGIHSSQQLQEIIESSGAVRLGSGAPAEVSERLELRPGFANHQFNRAQFDQIAKQLSAFLGRQSSAASWQFRLSAADESTVEIVLNSEAWGMRWNDQPLVVQVVEFDKVADTRRAPTAMSAEANDTVELLLTIGFWHQASAQLGQALNDWQNVGDERSDDSHLSGSWNYAGQAPLPLTDATGATWPQLANVLRWNVRGFVFDAFVDPVDGALLAIELRHPTSLDSCAVVLHDWQSVDSMRWPRQWLVLSGDQEVARLELQAVGLGGESLNLPGRPIARSANSDEADLRNVVLNAHGSTEQQMPPIHLTCRREMLVRASEKVVKIYGAGGLRGLPHYQTGVTVDPSGMILTVYSHVMDTDQLSVVDYLGRRYGGTILRVDPLTNLAVLKIEAHALPHFDLDEQAGTVPQTATSIWALSNLYALASGPEQVSIQRGVIASHSDQGRSSSSRFSSSSPSSILLDAITNNPGAAGGAVIDSSGRLLAVIGKTSQGREGAIWRNNAIAIDQAYDLLAAAVAGTAHTPAENLRRGPAAPSDPMSFSHLGIVFVPPVVPRTPAYIDRVLPDTTAAQHGVREDDLIIEIQGVFVRTLAEAEEQLAAIAKHEEVVLSIQRDGELKRIVLKAE